MYGGSDESHSSLVTTVSPSPVRNVNQPPRLSYSKQQLICMRSNVNTSPAFVEYLRANLGPVASTAAAHRWTLKWEADGLLSSREPNTLSSSSPSSPPNRIDEPPLHRDVASAEDSVHLTHGTDAAEPPSRTAIERDLSRIFQSSPDSLFVAKAARSPPTKRSEFANRLSVKTNGNGSMVPVCHDEKPKDQLASSPRDGTFHGVPDYRRPSPSPKASPRTSPKSSFSSSCPPGFGPPQNQRSSANHSSRTATNGKSRICRGPNLQENFASRIAYRQNMLSAGRATSAMDSSKASSYYATERTDVQNQQNPKSQQSSEATRRSVNVNSAKDLGSSVEPAQPPTLHFNISSDISFEDFSRRLAAEAGSSNIIENKDESEFIQVVDEGAMNGERGTMTRSETTQEDGSRITPPVPDQDAVDALSKWFGRIAASSHEQDQEEGTHVPEPSVEAPTAEIPFPSQQYNRDELDSNVLSFFDTIRSQALSQRNDLSLENGDDQNTDNEKCVTSLHKSARRAARDATRRKENEEDSERLNTTEVEQFFQLFTEGKPVFSTPSRKSVGKGVEAPRTEGSCRQDPSGSSSNAFNESQLESDTGGLERWFAALASGKQLQ